MIITFITWLSIARAEPAATVWSRGYYHQLRTALPAGKVQFVDQRKLAADEAAEGYLPPARRDAVFKKLKLKAALAPYDEVDKDLLVTFVRDSDAGELKRIQRKYPNLSLATLRRLRDELGRVK